MAFEKGREIAEGGDAIFFALDIDEILPANWMETDDGTNKKAFTLNRPYQGLLIKPGIWRTLTDFSSGSICMVLANEKYNEKDYIRSYEEFVKYRFTNIIKK